MLHVTCETPRDKLKRIPELMAPIVRSQEQTRFERTHFVKCGDFWLDFETVYHVTSADYTGYMDIRQAVFFTIHEAFARQGFRFAYPAHKLWLAMQAHGFEVALEDRGSSR